MNADKSLRLYANTFTGLLKQRVEDGLKQDACDPSDISSVDAGPSLVSGTMSDLFCDPCLEDGNHNQAEGYCVDCTHHLCGICFLHHRRPKPSRHHQLLDKQLMPKSKSDKVYKDECTEKCATHGEEILRYFCEDHELVGCTICVTLGHRVCNVGYIPTLSRDFCDSKEYKAFKRDIEYLARTTRSLQEAVPRNLEYIDKHAKRAKDEIRKLRKEIDIFFDDLEQDISDRVNKIQNEDKDKIESISKKCEELAETIKRLQADIEDKERTNQRCCLFVDVKELHDILEKYKNDISTMEKTNNIRDLTFRPSETISKLISDQSVEFGSLVDFCQTVSASSDLDSDSSSIAVLSGGRVAVFDTGSDCMKLIDSTHDSEVGNTVVQLKGEEETKSTPTADIQVTIERLPVSILREQHHELKRQNYILQQELNELEVNENGLKEQLQNVITEMKEAKLRLSAMRCKRPTDNNPNIANLGDTLRPTKLAELMSELYDNQWSEAFDYFYFENTWQGEFSERACMEFLLHVLMEVYTYCSRMVSAEWTSAINSLGLSMEKDQVLLKKLKDNRKAKALETLPRILEGCLETLKHIHISDDPGFDIILKGQAVSDYLKECVRLCWLMVVQNPPVYLYCYGWESSQPSSLLDYARKQVQTHYDGQENENARRDEHQGHRGGLDDTNEKIHSDGQENENARRDQHQGLGDKNGRDVKPETRGNGDSVPGRRNSVHFNKDHYREYTQRGAYLKFVVWPIVFLFKGGPVLQKGVAQGGD